MRQGKRHITYDSTNQLVSAANQQTYALSVTYGDWGKIQQYDLSQTDLTNNLTTSVVRNYGYGSLNEGQTTFAPNNISYADGTNVNEQYGINGSLLRRETNIPGNQPNEELYRFGADGNLRLYSYDRLFYSLYGYDGGTTRTYKYSFDLNPNWVNGRLESVNFNLHNAMFYPNSYLNFNQDGYYTKHYYNGMERIASRLGDQNLPINVNDPELQDRKDQLDSNIRRNIVEITGYEFLPVGEEQTLEDPKPIYELPVIGISNLLPSADGIYYYHSNHLGSTCYVTDENATVQQGFLYAPFGEITNEYNSSFGNNVLPKYSFNAKELDEETGMYYYEARYYQPPTFTSRDALFEEKPWLTPYHYCSNNPVVRVDPSGMMDWIPPSDGSGKWIAEKGDGYWRLSQQAGISLEEAKEAVIVANNNRGEKRTSETMVYAGDEVDVNIFKNKAEINIINFEKPYPSSGVCYPTSLIGTLIDLFVREPIQEGLEYLGMNENAAFWTSTGITFIGSFIASKKFSSSSTASTRIKYPGNNPAKAPKGFYWNGKPGSTPGSKTGNWYNPKTKESLRPDLNHQGPIGPHWDYRNASGEWFRIFPDNSIKPKL